MRRIFAIAVLAALSACASRPVEVPTAMIAIPVEKPVETGWRAIVSGADGQRLAQLPDVWRDALSASQRFRTQVRREGELLDPDAARNHPAPPPGSYRCRLVKIGEASGREPSFRSFPEFFCYVRGDRADSLFFAKQTGSELPGGYLHADGERRLVLTGAKQYASTDVPITYGAEPDRDLVGVVERIGPFRWRLVLPWRDGKEGLDVYELTPVPVEQQALEPPAEKGSDGPPQP